MAKTSNYSIFICVLLCLLSIHLESSCLTNAMDSQIGVKELTGRNDGKDVEKYLKSTGNRKGDPYCSSFVHWCLEQCGIKNTVTAFSPTSFNKKNIVYQKNKFLKEPQEGDVFCLWIPQKGRIGHTGFFRKRLNTRLYYTVEANTNQGAAVGSLADFDGEGVHKKIRSFHSTYSISRWGN